MFKLCPKCNEKWSSQEFFLNDKKIELIGYQPRFQEPLKGLFLFNHLSNGCNTTFSIEFLSFKNLSEVEITPDALEKPRDCPGYCSEGKHPIACTITNCRALMIVDVYDRLKRDFFK